MIEYLVCRNEGNEFVIIIIMNIGGQSFGTVADWIAIIILSREIAVHSYIKHVSLH